MYVVADAVEFVDDADVEFGVVDGVALLPVLPMVRGVVVVVVVVVVRTTAVPAVAVGRRLLVASLFVFKVCRLLLLSLDNDGVCRL
jgi:hypothetical protein